MTQNQMTSETPVETTGPQQLDDWFLELLECPGCDKHLPVTLAGEALHCACGRYAFPVRDGIPILLVDEAVLLNPAADPSQFVASGESGEKEPAR